MVSIDALRMHFGNPCKKLIKYDATNVEFSSVTAEYGSAKFGLGGFKTDLEKVRESSELANTIDDFQCNTCLRTRMLPKDVQAYYYEWQIAAIGLLSALRATLEAFNKDPDGERPKLQEIVGKMQEFMMAIADHVMKRMEIDSQKKLFGPRAQLPIPKALTDALALSGLTMQQTSELAEQFANK